MFKTRKSKFVTLEKARLRLTHKEYNKAKIRYDNLESSLDNKFKRIRKNKNLPKLDYQEV